VKAEILDLAARLDVEPALREDGTTGPPQRITITVRTCWRKPPVQLVAVLLHEDEHVAYYHVVERT
jgi:hypothetical protein